MNKTLLAPASVRVKSESETEGVVEAIVSVFNNVDLVGDRVVPGAFKDFVEKVKDGWKAPFVWSHQTHSPEMFIGDTIDAEETSEGLKITAALHLEEPTAAKVFKLIKNRQVRQYSFAYKVLEGRWVTEDDDQIYELLNLDVAETGPTMFGANPATRTVAAKDAPPVEREASEEPEGSTHESDEEPGKANEDLKQIIEVAHAAATALEAQ